jgi:ATP-dependent Lon protease
MKNPRSTILLILGLTTLSSFKIFAPCPLDADMQKEVTHLAFKVAGTYLTFKLFQHFFLPKPGAFSKGLEDFNSSLKDRLKPTQNSFWSRLKESDDLEDLKNKNDSYEIVDFPPAALESVVRLLKEFDATSPFSSNREVLTKHLDCIFSMPWNIRTPDNQDLENAQSILDAEHFGLNKVKTQILDGLAARTFQSKQNAKILCLSGPPGVGKTSIGKSIANSLGRKFVRISLGGIHDEAEIRGHRKTYIGAMPGRIIKAIKEAGSCNPVILLDEIEKLGSSHNGDPAAALLEVLDPGQNSEFTDHFLEVPFDLSQVMFVATCNDLSKVPAPLRDRMEVIRLSGYTYEEKLEIANKHLVPKSIKDSGLADKGLCISPEVVEEIISGYTCEAGVRDLKRYIDKLCSKFARALKESSESHQENPEGLETKHEESETMLKNYEAISFTTENLHEHLGPRKFRSDCNFNTKTAGISNWDKLENTKLSPEAYLEAKNLLDRLESMPGNSSEKSVIENQLDCIFSMPWNVFTTDNQDLENAQSILDAEHFGLNKVKTQILDGLAARTFQSKQNAKILCLSGPPGVGKTSIGKSIANSLGRKFVRISLGGIHNEAEIRGHRKTYIGAMPGRIIKAIKEAGSCNPVILLDEIEKLGSSHNGDPAAALLEVLDPGQNSEFTDHFLEVPFDLSQVMFVATCNDLSKVPGPLKDRMEVIRLSGYTYEEKLEIANKHLVPKSIKDSGLADKGLCISPEVVEEIISGYTCEAGVRDLKRYIDKLCSKFARTLKENQTALLFTLENLHEHLGHRILKPEKSSNKHRIGVVNGLSYNSIGGNCVGGSILKVETAIMPGKGKLILTGHLGDDMKESAIAARSYVRAHAKDFGIEDETFANNDLHVHFPEAAMPKDGPSAGLAITTSILSACTGRPVDCSYAMTGEVSLDGSALKIGGLKEKSLGAKQYGIKTIIVPEENRHDAEETIEDVKGIEFVFVDNVSQVIDRVLLPAVIAA